MILIAVVPKVAGPKVERSSSLERVLSTPSRPSRCEPANVRLLEIGYLTLDADGYYRNSLAHTILVHCLARRIHLVGGEGTRRLRAALARACHIALRRADRADEHSE